MARIMKLVGGYEIIDAAGDSVLIQTDWDYPGIAQRMGRTACHQCGETDGTVDCAHHSVSDMIEDAQAFIDLHCDEEFVELDDYFEGRE